MTEQTRHPCWRRAFQRIRVDYRLVGLQAVGDISIQIGNFGVPFIAIELFGKSTALAGLMTFCIGLPYLILGTRIGRYVDGHTIRSSLAVAIYIRILSLVSVIGFIQGHNYFSTPLLVALLSLSMTVLGAGSSIYEISVYSLITRSMSADRLAYTNSYLLSATSTALLVIPALSAAIVSTTSVATLYAVDTLIAVLAIFHLLRRSDAGAAMNRPPDKVAHVGRSGFGLILKQPDLLDLVMVSTALKFFVRSGNVVFIIGLSAVFDMRPIDMSVLIAMTGIGVLLSSTFGWRWGAKSGLRQTLIFSALGSAFAWGMIGVAFWFPKLPHTMILLGVGNLAFGFCTATFNSSTATLKQKTSPSEAQAAVHASFQMLGWSALAAGSLVGGETARIWSFPAVFLSVGIGIGLGALMLTIRPARYLRLVYTP